MVQAAAFDPLGEPGVLALRTLPLPEVADDEVLIRVYAASVGDWDAVPRDGSFAPEGSRLPVVPGADGAGTVVAVGKQVSRAAVGDVVYAYAYAYARPKGNFYAEYAVTKADWTAPLPAGLPLEQAAALIALSGLDTLGLAAGRTLLVFGASGGVGHLAVQLAKRQGLVVVAVASGTDGVAPVERQVGPEPLDGRDADTRLGDGVRGRVHAFAPQGVDGLLAVTGGDARSGLLGWVRPGGRVAYPNGVEPVPSAPGGVTATAYDGEVDPARLARLNELIAAGPFTVHVAARFLLAQAAEAHRALQRHYLGKRVLEVA